MKVCISHIGDPFANAALEDAFYKTSRADNESVLLFYVNKPTVVFGRSQNPWMEADIPWCLKNDIHILRRFSGGGTVVHDSGNLNYSFFVPRNSYNPDHYVGMVIRALAGLGVPDVHMEGQHSIYAGQYKISGSAFALNSRTAMLHGCILVNSDLKQLSRALHINTDYIFKTSTVPSVRASVKNITDFVPGLLVSDICQAIIDETAPGCLPEQPPLPDVDTIAIYNSPEWTYGRTPAFTFCYAGMEISVRQGIVDSPEELKGIDFTQCLDAIQQL